MDDRHRAWYFRRINQHADPRKTARPSRHCVDPSARRELAFSNLSARCNGFAALLAALLHCCIPAAVAQTVPLYGTTVVRFATAEESRLRLGTRDAFVAALSEYDRSARTGRRGAVPEADFLAFAAGQALD